MKLAAKFIALLVIGFIILLAVDSYLIFQREEQLVRNELGSNSRELLHVVRNTWRVHGRESAMTVIHQSNQDEDFTIRVFARQEPITGVDTPEYMSELKRIAGAPGDQEDSFPHINSSGNRFLVTFTEFQHSSGPTVEPIVVAVEQPVHNYQQAFQNFATRVFLKTTITFLLGGAFVLFLGRELVAKPVARLTEKTRRIGRGDLTKPLDSRRWDEFGELAKALDTMCEQLSEAHQRAERESEARISTTEQLRHAERLHTVGRLASGIAHEMGTPLNVVSGRAGLIASGKLSGEETKESAEIIKGEVDRITKIIRQLLDFARESTPQKTLADLQDVVSGLLQLLEPLAVMRNYKIIFTPGKQPLMATVDVDKIQQVLTNLIMNAAQSMPNGGDIVIRFRREGAPALVNKDGSPQELICVEVHDEGTGISEEDLNHVFEPFFTTKGVGMGTGLGLSIAYGIVQEHGGWIDATSKLGQGSCFSVYLPAETAQ